MSNEGLLTLLARAAKQPAFRALLLDAPDQALAGYVLTPAEVYRVRTLTPEVLDQLIGELKLHRAARGSRNRAN